MGYVYHGSNISGLKTIKPHKSTHGDYLYASKDYNIAVIFSGKYGGDIYTTISRIDKDKGYDIIERVPGVLSKIYSNSASIYTLNDESFKSINTGFNEVVSKKEEEVLNEEYISNIYEKINELNDEGKINLYYYPDRPKYIPEDDSDLVDKLKKFIYELNIDLDEYSFSRWIFMHPNIESEIRSIAESKNIELKSYDEIRDFFIGRQEENSDIDYFIDNALEMYDLCSSRKRL